MKYKYIVTVFSKSYKSILLEVSSYCLEDLSTLINIWLCCGYCLHIKTIYS